MKKRNDTKQPKKKNRKKKHPEETKNDELNRTAINEHPQNGDSKKRTEVGRV